MKRFASVFLFAATLVSGAGDQTFTGLITDSMCGASHQAMKISPDSKCVLECVKSGGSVKFALYDGKNTFKLSDQATPAQYAGQKVKVTGTLFAKTSIIQVGKIEPVK